MKLANLSIEGELDTLATFETRFMTFFFLWTRSKMSNLSNFLTIGEVDNIVAHYPKNSKLTARMRNE
jgi:hypothetical protein